MKMHKEAAGIACDANDGELMAYVLHSFEKQCGKVRGFEDCVLDTNDVAASNSSTVSNVMNTPLLRLASLIAGSK